MRKTNEEKGLLAKLASGVLNGVVCEERVYRGYKKGEAIKNVFRLNMTK